MWYELGRHMVAVTDQENTMRFLWLSLLVGLLPVFACDSSTGNNGDVEPGRLGAVCDEDSECADGWRCTTEQCLTCCPGETTCTEQCCGRCVVK